MSDCLVFDDCCLNEYNEVDEGNSWLGLDGLYVLQLVLLLLLVNDLGEVRGPIKNPLPLVLSTSFNLNVVSVKLDVVCESGKWIRIF